jgi:hypothetical protein
MGYSSAPVVNGLSAMKMLEHVGSYHVGEKWQNDDSRHEVIAGQPGKGGVWFVVRKTLSDTGATFDYAVVVLTSREKGEFFWKAIAEFSGPGYYSMPKALFRQLTPLENLPASMNGGYAKDWRERQAKAHKAKAAAGATVPHAGDVIVFREPCIFKIGGDDIEVSRFRVNEWGRKRRLTALHERMSGFNVKLRSSTWDSNPFEIEGQRATLVQVVDLSDPIPVPAAPQFKQVALF